MPYYYSDFFSSYEAFLVSKLSTFLYKKLILKIFLRNLKGYPLRRLFGTRLNFSTNRCTFLYFNGNFSTSKVFFNSKGYYYDIFASSIFWGGGGGSQHSFMAPYMTSSNSYIFSKSKSSKYKFNRN